MKNNHYPADAKKANSGVLDISKASHLSRKGKEGESKAIEQGKVIKSETKEVKESRIAKLAKPEPVKRFTVNDFVINHLQ